MSSLEEVLANIPDKKTRERARAASDITIEYLRTPSATLNRALNGGLPFGRQVLIWGNKASGKSSLCLQLVAEAQRAGKSCLWVDVEKTFDPKWASRMGVDTEKLLVEQISDSVRVVDDVSKFMKAGIDMVVIDSITSLVPMAYFEKDSQDLKGLEGTRAMGSAARDTSEAVRLWNQSNQGNTLLVLISQERNALGSMYVSSTSTNGKAPRFYSTTILKLWSSESLKQAKMGEVRHGDYMIQEPVGREVGWTVEANKTGKPWQQGKYDFYFDGERVGIDTLADTVDLAVSLGIIKQRGAWFYYGEELKFQGRDNLINHFLSLPDDYEILKKEVTNV
jgi:recombination protein RecA